MENFLLSLEVVAPLFFMMLLGYAIRHRQFVDRHAQDVMNKLVFQIFLPLLLFRNVYESDLSHAVNPLLILLAIVGTIVTFIILCALVKRVEPCLLYTSKARARLCAQRRCELSCSGP